MGNGRHREPARRAAVARDCEIGIFGGEVMKTEILSAASGMTLERLRSFFADDSGDDLIEYALLTTLIGLVGITAFSILSTVLSTAYTAWNTAVVDLWESPAP